MRRLLAAIGALIRSWLTIDRIRSGQSLQQLTTLQVGAMIFVEGEPAVVVNREVTRAHEGRVLKFDCSTESGRATLRIEYHSTERAPLLTWERACVLSTIPFDEIVIPRQSRHGEMRKSQPQHTPKTR